MGFFEKLKQSLKKTRVNFAEKLNKSCKKDEKITDEFYDDLEEILIMCDIGASCSCEIIEEVKKRVKQKKIKFKDEAKNELISVIEEILKDENNFGETDKKTVILMLGVNGVGKTTTIAKLSYFLKQKGKTVLIAAADTFRAAAIDQLEIWAKRVDCPIIKHQENSDPASVIFDSINAAKKRNYDYVICDTAGRLHTKKNLMSELEKISRVVKREGENFNKEFLLTIDATTGQNGLIQAEKFKETSNLTGIVLTKLDGTAKGGIVIPIKKNLNLPIKFIGTGEQISDLQLFDADMFTKALFSLDKDEEK